MGRAETRGSKPLCGPPELVAAAAPLLFGRRAWSDSGLGAAWDLGQSTESLTERLWTLLPTVSW